MGLVVRIHKRAALAIRDVAARRKHRKLGRLCIVSLVHCALDERDMDVSVEEEEYMSVPKHKRRIRCEDCVLWMGGAKRNDHHYCRGVAGKVIHDCAGFARGRERSARGA